MTKGSAEFVLISVCFLLFATNDNNDNNTNNNNYNGSHWKTVAMCILLVCRGHHSQTNVFHMTWMCNGRASDL